MSLIFLVLALLCWLVAALSDFGWLLNADHPIGWIAWGLVFYVLAKIVGPVFALRERG